MKKKEIILYIFDCLSDIEFQRKVWVNGEQFDMYCSSFGETVNSLDDFNFFDDIENKVIRLEKNEDQAKLQLLINKLLNYQEPNSTNEMLHDETWINIVKESAQVRTLLDNIL